MHIICVLDNILIVLSNIVIHIMARLEVLPAVPLKSTEKKHEIVIELPEDRNHRKNLLFRVLFGRPLNSSLILKGLGRNSCDN